MPRVLTPKARRLHAEAQKRYLDRLVKRNEPTTEAVLRAVGRAAIEGSAMAAQMARAQIVNTEGFEMTAGSLGRFIMQAAAELLVADGYDRGHCMTKLRKLLQEAALARTATEAAQDSSDATQEASEGIYRPGA